MKTFFSIAISAMLALPFAAIAADNVASGTPYRIKPEIRNIIKDVRGDIRQEARDLRASTTEEIKAFRQGAIDAIKQKREDLRQALEQARADFKNAIDLKRAEVRDKIKTKREELKLKLQKIKDERKRQVVEKVDSQLDALNARWVSQSTQALEQIEDVLGRVATRTDEIESGGKNVSDVRVAIENARSAIAASRSAIGAQAGKTYTILINKEGTLKQDVGVARQALHADLVSMRETVKTARDAVHNVAIALGQIVNPQINNGATSTTSTSTQF